VVGARALDGWLAVAVAIALPLVVVAAWGRWVGPRSRHLLPDPARAGVEAVVFLGGAVGLFVVGLVGWAVALAVVATVSAVGVRLLPWEPGAPS
jgi:purine-cytosine permease-like protein